MSLDVLAEAGNAEAEQFSVVDEVVASKLAAAADLVVLPVVLDVWDEGVQLEGGLPLPEFNGLFGFVDFGLTPPGAVEVVGVQTLTVAKASY